MVAATRSTCISISTPLAREKISIIYYLLSIIYYLKSPVVQVVFVRPLRLGLLFQAESVGASLEAPDTPCPLQPRKSQIVGGSFMGKQCNG